MAAEAEKGSYRRALVSLRNKIEDHLMDVLFDDTAGVPQFLEEFKDASDVVLSKGNVFVKESDNQPTLIDR